MRLIPVLLIALAVVVSVGAVANILPMAGFGVTEWYGPLAVLQITYRDLIGVSFGMLDTMLDSQFGIAMPQWGPHVAAIYVCAALAFVAGTTGLAKRDNSLDGMKATALGVAIPFAIPLFLWEAVRLGLVSRFARDNTLSFFGYVLMVAGTYYASVWANEHIYAPKAAIATDLAALAAPEMAALGHFDARSGSVEIGNAVGEGRAILVSAGAAGRAGMASLVGDQGRLEHGRLRPEEARMIGDAIGRNLRAQMVFSGGAESPRRMVVSVPQPLEDALATHVALAADSSATDGDPRRADATP